MFDLALAVGHHLFVFALLGILAVECALVRRGITRAAVATVARIDLWYGIIAGAIVVLGFVRAIFAAKGWAYYSHNAFFWAKIGTFVAIAVLSIPPTLNYIRWARREEAPDDRAVAGTQRFLYAELLLFALLPIFAAAMARGFGTLQ